MTDLHIARRLANFARRDAFDRLWFLPVWLGLGVASLLIACLEFRRIAPLLGHQCGTERLPVTLNAVQKARAMRIGSTVKLAARCSPWRADCYPQAIVARWLLGLHRMPCTLFMGVKRDSDTGEMLAHAWVESGEVCVCGEQGDEDYHVIATFSGRSGDSRGEVSERRT